MITNNNRKLNRYNPTKLWCLS